MFAGWYGIAGAVYTLIIVYVAWGDIRNRRIPNSTVALLGVLGIVFAVIAGPGTPALLRVAGGFGTGMAIWLPFYVVGWLGAGDVKLFAAAGIWLGPTRTVEGSLIAALAGAVLAIGWMVWRYGGRQTAATLSVATAAPSVLAPSGRVVDRKRTLPYGVALAVGALVAAWLPGTVLFQ